MSIKKYLMFAIAVVTNIAATYGQTPPNTKLQYDSHYNPGLMLNQRIKELQRYRMDLDAERFKNKAMEESSEPQTPVEQNPDLPDVKVKVSKLEIPDSAVLDRKVLDAISETYNDREVTISDLYEALNKINALYFKKGYITARAILPPQKIEEGIVRIQLIEGIVGNIEVLENTRTKSSYIKKRLEIPTGKVPNINALKHRIQNFNVTNETILQIKMVAGKEPLTTDFYIVAVEPKKSRNYSLFTDNSGSKNSGEWRYGLSYSDINLTGICDILNIVALFSRSSKTGTLSYNRPVNKRGTEVTVNYSANDMKVTYGELESLNVKGKSNTISLGVMHPTFTSARKREQLIFDISSQNSKTTILGSEFVNDKLKRFSAGYSWMYLKNNQLVYFKPMYTYESYKGLAEERSSKRISVESMWQKYMKNHDTLTVRLSGQKILGDYVPSTDYYYLGGQYSVRGYEENGIGGESGINIKLDYGWHTNVKGLKLITFFDYGRLFGETLLTTKQIYSAGIGFEYQYKRVVATLYTGFALKRHIGDQETDNSNTHFSLNYIF